MLPQDCLLCDAPSVDHLLCPDCANSLPPLPADLCPVCALPAADGMICGACLKQPPAFDQTIACGLYAFPTDKLVQQLKFGHRLAIADFFARTLLAHGLPDADVIMPVPLSAKRLRERGFNQAAEIARCLGRECGMHVDLFGCRRPLETTPQSSLPWKARQKNIRGAFECDGNLVGKRVLVIDDVMTTGATLGEFARLLKDHGAVRVINCVAARAVKGCH